MSYGEFRRVVEFLDAQGIRFSDRDGDHLPLKGHTVRGMADRYAATAPSRPDEYKRLRAALQNIARACTDEDYPYIEATVADALHWNQKPEEGTNG